MLHTEVDEGKEIFRINKKRHRRKKNVNERSGIAEKLLTQNTLYRLQGSLESNSADYVGV